ncbi:MAG: hypothetical protein JSS91_05905 [Bacteroidetes bacterium]|nr:hypothetical protein [Bacteroidota bacterium]
MSFWKIESDKKPEKVSSTKLKNEHILEKHLENWVAGCIEILEEPLLIIGRQVIIPNVKDRLDLLALDPNGNAVIIELKRGKMNDPVDMQALRYASYLSKWDYSDFENQAKSYLSTDDEFNFNEIYEKFCIQSGVDEIPDINGNQRIIIVGSEVKDKLGSVALWLYDHNIDIKVIEIDSFKEGDAILIQPRIIIPLEVNKFSDVGKAAKGDVSKPWINSGKSWHLEKRMKIKTKELFLQLDNLIQDNIPVQGPNYNQKSYISYQSGNHNWLLVRSKANSLLLQFAVKAKSMNSKKIAEKLNVEIFDAEDSLSEKLSLPSSIIIKNRNETSDRIYLRIKEDFDLNNPEFLDFLKNTIKNSSKT